MIFLKGRFVMGLKKLFSFFLASLMLFTCFSFAVNASAAENYPIVYVQGQGQMLYAADGHMIYDGKHVPVPDGALTDGIKKCLPDFIDAVLLGEWDEWHDSFMEIWEPIYKEVRLDNNGENTNGSHGWWDINTCRMDPYYDMGSYHYTSDWRLDPFYNAGILDQFIQNVKQKTGAAKVNMVARCEGCNIVMAYLAEYGYDDINCLELYASSANGVDMVGAVFCGEFEFYPEELRDFYYASNVDIGDENVSELIDSALDWLVDSYGFEGACDLLKKISPKMYEKVIYDVLLTSYGTFPGIWSLVGPQYYAKARQIVFEGRTEEYSGLIEKIDRYDREVRQRNDELLLEAKAAGVKIAIIAKFGEFTYQVPVCEECNDVSDNAINVTNASYGAVISDNRYVQLPASYLAGADAKYISPCKRIDASTCALPDTTWFIYNADHNDFTAPMNVLLKKFFDMNGEMTIDTFAEFPQYLIKDGSTVRPMTEDDVTIDFEEQAQKAEENNFFSRFVRAFKAFFAMIKKAFALFFGGLKNDEAAL